MAKSKYQNKKNPSSVKAAGVSRPVDKYFAKYSDDQNPSHKPVYWICIPLIVFGLFGLLWAVPFPNLKFLGSLNGYFNWASFLIALSIYYYYKLSPILSYFMLLVFMLFSLAVIELAEWQAGGGPTLWVICLVIFIASLIALFIGRKNQGKKTSFIDDLKFLVVAPIWLLHFILKKFSIKY